MGPTRSTRRSTRRQQASQRGRTQANEASSHSPAEGTMQLPTGYSLANLIPRSGIADEIPRPLRKSHAKRQPAGHVPRPRNAFIIFRCDFVAARLIPRNVENNHRNISRIAGIVWGQLDTVQRTPWTTRAIAEKALHKATYPDYRYNLAPSAGESSPSAAADHSSCLSSIPNAEDVMSGSDLSASPAGYHEAQRLRIPGQRSYSAPPDSGTIDTKLHIPQPSSFPLPDSFFPRPSLDGASNVVVPYAPSPIHSGTSAPTYEQNSTMVGAQTVTYATVPVAPYAYDWRYTSADDPALCRYHETMQQYSLNEPLDSDRKYTAEELAAASYERAAPPQEFVDPHMYGPAYEYEVKPFLEPLEQFPTYHRDSEIPYEPRSENAWHSIAYTPFTAAPLGSQENSHNGYAAYAAYVPGPSTLVEGRANVLISAEAYTSDSGSAASWI